MKITLFDRNQALVDEFEKHVVPLEGLFGYPEIRAVCGDIQAFDLSDVDCLVSPGNSFGLMDGGLDRAIRDLVPGSQVEVQRAIYHQYGGECPVGSAVLAPCGAFLKGRLFYVAYAPTMRFPRVIDPEVVYDAARAALTVIAEHNRVDPSPHIDHVYFCGLGTATGGVPYEMAAKLTALAIESMHSERIFKTWEDVEKRVVKILEVTPAR